MGVFGNKMGEEDEVEAATLEQADEGDGENGNVVTETFDAMRTTMNRGRPSKQRVANLDRAPLPPESAWP